MVLAEELKGGIIHSAPDHGFSCEQLEPRGPRGINIPQSFVAAFGFALRAFEITAYVELPGKIVVRSCDRRPRISAKREQEQPESCDGCAESNSTADYGPLWPLVLPPPKLSVPPPMQPISQRSMVSEMVVNFGVFSSKSECSIFSVAR